MRGGDDIGRPFPATRHSALAALRAGGPERERALETLVAMYWRPIYGLLRLRFRKQHEDAADLTQDFFEALVERDLLAAFDPARGRLRTFLRVSLDGFAANQSRAARRLKRGGGAVQVSCDFEGARLELEAVCATAPSPEVLFDQEWTRAFFQLALHRLEGRCLREGKEQHFRLFEQYELGAARSSYAELAERFGIATTDVTNRLAWTRRELRATVLELLRECTAGEAEFRAEARLLLGLDAP